MMSCHMQQRPTLTTVNVALTEKAVLFPGYLKAQNRNCCKLLLRTTLGILLPSKGFFCKQCTIIISLMFLIKFEMTAR